MKKTVLSILMILALALATLALYTKDIPETISLKGEKKEAVEFPHTLHHTAIDNCQECHHNMPEGAEFPENACRDCHTNDHEVKPMKAFHNSCVKCHRDSNKENDTKLPTKCTECHVK